MINTNEWCVVFTRADNMHSTSVQGPFESKEIAEKFAKLWNEKRQKHIDEIIDKDPDGEYDFIHIVAKECELHFSPSSLKILEEIN